LGPTFVLLLREGLEASLIVGILLAYLVAVGRRDRFRSVWLGIAAALAVSIAVGTALFATRSRFEGRAEEIFEGLASLAAVGVLTGMVFWMRSNAVNLSRSLKQRVSEALGAPSGLALASVAFLVVVREGIETSLFLFAVVRQVGAVGGAVGAALGLAVAVALGVGTYQGGIRINLGSFFTWTGGILLVIAAGLLAFGLHELIEAGAVPAGVEEIWNLRFLPDDSGVGEFLKTLIGYNANPALTEFLAWVFYLGVVGFAFFRPIVRVRRNTLASQQA
jgi:high-affinity iron transporter